MQERIPRFYPEDRRKINRSIQYIMTQVIAKNTILTVKEKLSGYNIIKIFAITRKVKNL